MADNVIVDNGGLTDIDVATDKVTYSGDADRNVQLLRQVHVAGSEGAKTVEAVTGTTGAAVPAAAVGIGGTDGTNLRLVKVDSGGELQVDVLSSALPSGAATLTEQQTQSGYLLNLQATVDVIGTAVPTSALYVAGTDGTNSRGLKTDASGELQVDVLTLPALAAGTANIGDVDVASIAAGTNYIGKVRITDGTNDLTVDTAHGDAESNTENHLDVAAKLMGFNGTDWDRLRSDTTNGLDVDVVRLPASTNTIEVVGDVAQDAAAAGNPVLVAASHETPADSAPANRVSADGDATRLSAVDGALFVIPSGPQQWKARLTGSMSDTTVKAAPGAGLSLYIQSIVYSIGAATASSILLEESTTTAVFGPHYLEAINGRGIAMQFNPPIKIAANTLLSATSTGATTNTLDVYGFTALG
jgi:hypothetical protein